MSRKRIVITADEWNAQLRDALPPTSDDVCITSDGRRLDTPEKLKAFLDELNAERDGQDSEL